MITGNDAEVVIIDDFSQMLHDEAVQATAEWEATNQKAIGSAETGQDAVADEFGQTHRSIIIP
jgi:hypothetical protein